MSDWQPGDLALCVKQGPWMQRFSNGGEAPCAGPMAGDVCLVVDVVVSLFGDLGLFFAEWPDYSLGGQYRAERFVKITPGADIEGIEAEKRRKVPA